MNNERDAMRQEAIHSWTQHLSDLSHLSVKTDLLNKAKTIQEILEIAHNILGIINLVLSIPVKNLVFEQHEDSFQIEFKFSSELKNDD